VYTLLKQGDTVMSEPLKEATKQEKFDSQNEEFNKLAFNAGVTQLNIQKSEYALSDLNLKMSNLLIDMKKSKDALDAEIADAKLKEVAAQQSEAARESTT